MENVAAHFGRVEDAVSGAGVQVVRSPSVSAPEGAAHIVVPLDVDAVATTLTLVAALSPRLVLLSGPDREGFDGHIVAEQWVRLVYLTPAALDEAEAAFDSANDDEARLDDDGRALLRAVEALKTEIGLSDHGGATELRQLIRERVRRDAPVDAERILDAGQYEVWELTSELHLALKDRHAAILRTRARDYAQRILEEDGPFSQPFLRAAQRDVAYRYLKRIDPACTTKASSDPVALELGALVNAAR